MPSLFNPSFKQMDDQLKMNWYTHRSVPNLLVFMLAHYCEQIQQILFLFKKKHDETSVSSGADSLMDWIILSFRGLVCHWEIEKIPERYNQSTGQFSLISLTQISTFASNPFAWESQSAFCYAFPVTVFTAFPCNRCLKGVLQQSTLNNT